MGRRGEGGWALGVAEVGEAVSCVGSSRSVRSISSRSVRSISGGVLSPPLHLDRSAHRAE